MAKSKGIAGFFKRITGRSKPKTPARKATPVARPKPAFKPKKIVKLVVVSRQAKPVKVAKPLKTIKLPRVVVVPKRVMDIENAITDIIGKDVVSLYKILRGKKNVSEFSLAGELRREINLVRNMLYRLSEHNLVTSTRKKDKKKGWYIYYWTLNDGELDRLIVKVKKEKIVRLQERIGREKSNQFFICANNCLRLDFDQAAGFNFRCPECNELLAQMDNSQVIAQLEAELKELEK